MNASNPGQGTGSLDSAVEDILAAQEAPEGLSVLVVACPNAALAAEVGPLLARRLFPDRRIGKVLHVEEQGAGAYEVVVRDHGTKET